jgi:hypothetical protein
MHYTIMKRCKCIISMFQKVVHVVEFDLESEDPNAMLHNNLIGEGFYKIKVLKCIVRTMPLPNPSEEEKMVKDVDGRFTR